MHEASMHGRSSFLTLTYDDEHVPEHGSLKYRDVQLFLKRLRKQYKIRFVCAGEYGPKTLRPHYHLCVFNYYPSDAKWCGGPKDKPLFSSNELDKLWSLGNTRTGELTHTTAAYVARYIMGKITGPLADDEYRRVCVDTGEIVDVERPFLKMSLKPGIGESWFRKNVFSPLAGTPENGPVPFRVDGPLAKGNVVVDGSALRQPKFYDRLLDRLDPALKEKVQFDRSLMVNPENVTPERLRARAAIVRARIERGRSRSDV